MGTFSMATFVNRRKQYPNTYQLWLDASLLGIGMPEEGA
jgi:hypothetical protein